MFIGKLAWSKPSEMRWVLEDLNANENNYSFISMQEFFFVGGSNDFYVATIITINYS